MRVSARDVLVEKGYSFIELVREPVEPDTVDYLFRDIVPELGSLEIGGCRLYRHQYEAYSALREGRNVILKAGTGSGKTEAWMLYVLSELSKGRRIRVLALYPTLVLANDQVKRITRYLSLFNEEVFQIDSVRRSELAQRYGSSTLRLKASGANIVVSNPAFILHDLKKYLVRKQSALLSRLYESIDLIVIDEIDFYSPRSIALLLAMIDVLSRVSMVKPQVVVLTATLSNPVDLGVFLRDVTGRDFTVIDGKPFQVENRYYIVLGRNMEHLWRQIASEWSSIVSRHRELEAYSSIVRDFEEFKKNAYKVISALEAVGYKVPEPGIDVKEIVSGFLSDEYLTIVFTRSISTAEEIARELREAYGESIPIATHHHLVSKKKREEVEDAARRGLVKVIISPRTLSQGIDIGEVARIIHLGLPDDVREFLQREGRKGRRRELGLAESIIIPFSRWDRELLSNGFDALAKWLELGVEKTLVNPGNLYIYLFTGVAKLKSSWFKAELSRLEEEALRRAGILTSEGVNQRMLDRVFERINFYEYAPPYGIKRYLERKGELIPLEPIGHCDLVEKFQPGCIDYSEDALVVALNHGRTSRHVRSIIEKDIREIDFYSNDALSVALEEYRYIKLGWGEKPQVVRDLLNGRITSEELCVVYVPRNGFGKYRKIPDRCIWTVRSEKSRIISRDGSPIVYYDKKAIYVPTPTGGEYRDFTYGYIYTVDPVENTELMRLALALLMIILRRRYGIAFETIMYDVVKIGEYKYFSLHEPEAAGVIDLLDWLDVRRTVEKYVFDDLDRILLSEIDDIAYSTLITIGFNWEIAREQLLRCIDYILARDKVRVKLSSLELTIPRPSPALKLLSIAIVSEVLDEESLTPSLLVSLGAYDGGEYSVATELYPPVPFIKPPQPLLSLEGLIMDKVVYGDYQLLVENREAVLSQAKRANLRQLVNLLTNPSVRIIDVSEEASRQGFALSSLEEGLASLLSREEYVDPAEVMQVFHKIRGDRRLYRDRAEVLERFLRYRAKSLYITHLVLSEYASKGGRSDST